MERLSTEEVKRRCEVSLRVSRERRAMPGRVRLLPRDRMTWLAVVLVVACLVLMGWALSGLDLRAT